MFKSLNWNQFLDILDSISRIQTARAILVVVVCILAFIICLAAFRKNINQVSKQQIQRFIMSGKYMPDVYVELNDDFENLRYFIYAYHWKRRIIRRYNQLFKGFVGRKMVSYLGDSCCHSLSIFTSLTTVQNEVHHVAAKLNAIRSDEAACRKQYGEEAYFFRNCSSDYIRALDALNTMCDMIKARNIILVGSAGNGKTSLACRMTEMIMANKMPCLMLNSRDIELDCIQYFKKYIPLYKKLSSISNLYMHAVSFLLFLQRKYFFIIIDAINENDANCFVKSIGKVPDYFSHFRRFRVLMTCRSEYFSTRYQSFFSNTINKPLIVDLAQPEYDDRATLRLMSLYAKHFNVHGIIPLEIQEKMMSSLLLTRILFEVNCNRKELELEFRNAEIYDLYFNKIKEENPDVRFQAIVDGVAEHMLETNNFGSVDISELKLSAADLNAFRKMLDNNLIISRTIKEGMDVTKRDTEYVYFVFDELRDYCFSRHLLTLGEKKCDAKFNDFFLCVRNMFIGKKSPVEGVLKYGYHYFRIGKRYSLCSQILLRYGETDVQEITDQETRYDRRRYKPLDNFGLSLILSECSEILPFEMNYISICVKNNKNAFWDMFWYLLQREYSKILPNVKLALDTLLNLSMADDIKSILHLLFEDRFSKYSYIGRNEPRRIDILMDWVTHINRENGSISLYLKAFLVILCTYDFAERALYDCRTFIEEPPVYNYLASKIKCEEFLQELDKMKNQREYPKSSFLISLTGDNISEE